MSVVIHGRATGIHAHRIVHGGCELLHLTGERVVESKRQTEIVAKDRTRLNAWPMPSLRTSAVVR
jgi:hypothetical protein